MDLTGNTSLTIGGSAIILAGGQSSRMKTDKALLPINGKRMIELVTQNLEPYFNEIIISTHSRASLEFLPYKLVEDKEQGYGPLMGILCGLEVSSNDVNFVMACDIPEIDISFITEMMSYTQQYEIVVPLGGEDEYEPLFAFYNRSLIGRINDLLGRGIKKIIELYSLASVKYIPFDKNAAPFAWYYNLNTVNDYHNYMKKI